MDKTPIRHKNSSSGFTLMEILIVLAIMAGMLILTVQRKPSSQKVYRQYFRKLSTMAKEVRNRAQLRGSTIRLYFEFESEGQIKYWAEEAPGRVLVGDAKKIEEEIRDLYKEIQVKKTSTNPKKKRRGKFKELKRYNSKQIPPPSTLEIKQVEIGGLDSPINEDLAFFHFFPEGFVEETAIQFQTKDKELKWTLATDPLTGELLKLDGHVSLRDIRERR